MSRGFSWAPLAGSDPTPGDPVAIDNGARAYRDVARASERATATLERLMTGTQMDSDAVRALDDRAREVRESIEKVSARYSGVAGALEGYASSLRPIHTATETMLADAQEAEHARDRYLEDASRYRSLARNATAQGDDEAATRFTTLASAADSNASREAGKISTLRNEHLPTQVSRWDTAAEDAIRAINTATDDGLNDGWWENWGADVLQIVSKVAGAIAAVAGVLALVLCWVPGLNAALAAVAAIAGGVALIADTILALTGEKGWGDVVLGAVALVTLGVGRAVTPLVRASMAARASSGSTALARTSSAAGSVSVRTSTTTTAAAYQVTRVHHGAGAFRSAFTPAVLREARSELNPIGLFREARGLFSGANYRGIPDAFAGLRANPVHQVAAATFDPATASRMVPSPSSSTALVPAGSPLPNSIQFVAGHQGPGGTWAIQGVLSFDAFVGAAPAVTSVGTFAGVSTYDTFQTVSDATSLGSDVFSNANDFGTWMTGRTGQASAPYELNLR